MEHAEDDVTLRMDDQYVLHKVLSLCTLCGIRSLFPIVTLNDNEQLFKVKRFHVIFLTEYDVLCYNVNLNAE